MYIEPFDKNTYTRSTIYSVAFLFFQIFGGKILSFIPSEIISLNMTFWVYGLLFALVIILFGKKILLSSLKNFDKTFLSTLAVVGMITFFSIVFSGIALSLMGITNSNENGINDALSSSHLNFVLTAVAAIIFAPIAEELFFRFVLYRSIAKVHPLLAHACVALLFGFFHVWGYVLIEGDYIQLVNMMPYICMSLGFRFYIISQKTSGTQ